MRFLFTARWTWVALRAIVCEADAGVGAAAITARAAMLTMKGDARRTPPQEVASSYIGGP